MADELFWRLRLAMSQCRHRACGYLVAVDSATRLPPQRCDDTAAAGMHPKKLRPLLISATVESSSSNLVCNLWLGLSYQKQRLGSKLAEGGWARGASEKKFGTLYLFLQPLNLATSNLVYNFGLRPAYQKKTTFRTKIGGGLGQGSIQI